VHVAVTVVVVAMPVIVAVVALMAVAFVIVAVVTVALMTVAVAIVGTRGRRAWRERLVRFEQGVARRGRRVRLAVVVSAPGVVVLVVVVVRMSHAAPDLRGSVRHVVATRDRRRRKLGVFGEPYVLLKGPDRAPRGPERYAA
jgi:hypothetical protein